MLTEEQKLRIEKNKQEALSKRQKRLCTETRIYVKTQTKVEVPEISSVAESAKKEFEFLFSKNWNTGYDVYHAPNKKVEELMKIMIESMKSFPGSNVRPCGICRTIGVTVWAVERPPQVGYCEKCYLTKLDFCK